MHGEIDNPMVREPLRIENGKDNRPLIRVKFRCYVEVELEVTQPWSPYQQAWIEPSDDLFTAEMDCTDLDRLDDAAMDKARDDGFTKEVVS